VPCTGFRNFPQRVVGFSMVSFRWSFAIIYSLLLCWLNMAELALNLPKEYEYAEIDSSPSLYQLRVRNVKSEEEVIVRCSQIINLE
jgi:hypothetical protein